LVLFCSFVNFGYKYNMEKLNEEQITKESLEAFSILSSSLGEDCIHKEILLEELIKLLLRS